MAFASCRSNSYAKVSAVTSKIKLTCLFKTKEPIDSLLTAKLARVRATSSLLPSTLLIATPVITHRYNPINSATILAGSLIGSHCLDSSGRGVCITNRDRNISTPPTIPSRSMHLSGADLYAVGIFDTSHTASPERLTNLSPEHY
jgi:hypothetical protein